MKIFTPLLFGLVLSAGNLRAEERDDPNDLWFRGFLLTKKAEDFNQQQKYIESLNSLNEAFLEFKKLSLEHPDFVPRMVKLHLQRTAEKQFKLKATLRKKNPSELPKSDHVKRLEAELEALKSQLRKLEERREGLDSELKDLKGAVKPNDFGFNLDWEVLPPTLSFQERVDDGEESIFSRPRSGYGLDPQALWELERKLRRETEPKEELGAPEIVPENWIPRRIDGEMTYLIPLVEMLETRRFSSITPVGVVPNAATYLGK